MYEWTQDCGVTKRRNRSYLLYIKRLYNQYSIIAMLTFDLLVIKSRPFLFPLILEQIFQHKFIISTGKHINNPVINFTNDQESTKCQNKYTSIYTLLLLS